MYRNLNYLYTDKKLIELTKIFTDLVYCKNELDEMKFSPKLFDKIYNFQNPDLYLSLKLYNQLKTNKITIYFYGNSMYIFERDKFGGFVMSLNEKNKFENFKNLIENSIKLLPTHTSFQSIEKYYYFKSEKTIGKFYYNEIFNEGYFCVFYQKFINNLSNILASPIYSDFFSFD